METEKTYVISLPQGSGWSLERDTLNGQKGSIETLISTLTDEGYFVFDEDCYLIYESEESYEIDGDDAIGEIIEVVKEDE